MFDKAFKEDESKTINVNASKPVSESVKLHGTKQTDYSLNISNRLIVKGIYVGIGMDGEIDSDTIYLEPLESKKLDVLNGLGQDVVWPRRIFVYQKAEDGTKTNELSCLIETYVKMAGSTGHSNYASSVSVFGWGKPEKFQFYKAGNWKDKAGFRCPFGD